MTCFCTPTSCLLWKCTCTFSNISQRAKDLLVNCGKVESEAFLAFCAMEFNGLLTRNCPSSYRIYLFPDCILIPHVWEFKNACFHFFVLGKRIEMCTRGLAHKFRICDLVQNQPKHLQSFLPRFQVKMPFTTTQITLFFQDQAYMSLTAHTTDALAAKGITIPDDFFEFDKEGMESIFQNLRKLVKVLRAGVAGVCSELQ